VGPSSPEGAQLTVHHFPEGYQLRNQFINTTTLHLDLVAPPLLAGLVFKMLVYSCGLISLAMTCVAYVVVQPFGDEVCVYTGYTVRYASLVINSPFILSK
jgi:hypothetical protein